MNKELQFLLYATPQEDVKVNVAVKDETLWITQKAMSELFNVGIPAISKHIKNIFKEGELDEKVIVSKMETTIQQSRENDCRVIYGRGRKGKCTVCLY